MSSEGGPTAESAERIVGWYEQRWAIEEYFRRLKTGKRIADRRLREADALLKCQAFDAITACQVFSLGRYARDAPETQAEDLLPRGRAGDDRGARRAPSVAAAGRARQTARDGHPQLRGAAGTHGRLAAQQAAALSRQRGALAGIRAPANDGARDANPAGTLTASASGCGMPVHSALGTCVNCDGSLGRTPMVLCQLCILVGFRPSCDHIWSTGSRCDIQDFIRLDTSRSLDAARDHSGEGRTFALAANQGICPDDPASLRLRF